MISYVAQVLHLFASAVRSLIHLASNIGKLIIIGITWISSVVVSALNSVSIFFQIVYEDNIAIFTEDIPSSTNALIDCLADHVIYLWNTLTALFYGAYIKFSAIITTICETIDAAVIITHAVFLLLKKTIVFLGDSLWLVITFIPVHLPQLLKALIGYSVNRIVDGYMTLLTVTNFLTEVPLESFVGLMSAIIIIRLSVHFRENIKSQIISVYWSLVRNVSYFYYICYNYFTNSEVRVITQMSSGEGMHTREADFSADDMIDAVNQADSFCVICQERQKCVLTLPCRHVCLCTECCRRLYGYQRTCPICRTFIYHSVTVYL